MSVRKTNAANTTVTRDMRKFVEHTGNMYETLVIISKRSNQIAAELKEELNGKLDEFNTHVENLEEVFENREQIEISRYYEKLPKPSLLAVQEWIDGDIYFRHPEEETN
ncbi:MAG: DNA-directed RNA polymerase subunit omega [Flavobacteriales bacterium]|nr:DNA-directed RNA polymerase subunit omega [Flavobacteriales bacterium]